MRMVRGVAALGLAALLMGLAEGSAATARESAAERRCTGQARIKPETRIAACTALIKSGRFHGQALAKLYRGRAEALEQRGETDRATEDYRSAIALDPNQPPAQTEGTPSLPSDSQGEAAAGARAVSEQDRRNAEVHNTRGLTWFDRKDYEKAVAEFDAAIRSAPGDPRAYNNR